MLPVQCANETTWYPRKLQWWVRAVIRIGMAISEHLDVGVNQGSNLGGIKRTAANFYYSRHLFLQRYTILQGGRTGR